MTASKLIEALQKLNPDEEVICQSMDDNCVLRTFEIVSLGEPSTFNGLVLVEMRAK